ncbi:endonuclease [Cupriavidus sp. 2TAF22]|uniref:endonuclease n=1 Tax=unclassified Cupriavidus TaxID=2640874 RepID=UPI003F926093
MKHSFAKALLMAGAAMASVCALAQGVGVQEPRSPYSQGGMSNSGAGLTDPYAGARAPDKFDPYTQGASQPVRTDLAPTQEPYMDQSQNAQLAYMDRSRWLGPTLGTRLGLRSRFLDGA